MTPTELTPARANVAQAAVMGLTTVAWYALPDLVRSRAVRTEPAKSAAVGAAIVGLTTAFSIVGEKAIFRFGEKRRARGATGAHTVPALVLGALGAASAAVPLP